MEFQTVCGSRIAVRDSSDAIFDVSNAACDGCDTYGDGSNATCHDNDAVYDSSSTTCGGNDAVYDSKNATCVGNMISKRIETKSTMTVSSGQNTGNTMNNACKE